MYYPYILIDDIAIFGQLLKIYTFGLLINCLRNVEVEMVHVGWEVKIYIYIYKLVE